MATKGRSETMLSSLSTTVSAVWLATPAGSVTALFLGKVMANPFQLLRDNDE
jgi:ABC-type phosphate transport system permease subunit